MISSHRSTPRLAALVLALASAGACGVSSATGRGHADPHHARSRGTHGTTVDGKPAVPPLVGDRAALCDDFSTLDLAITYADAACAGPPVIAIDSDPSAKRPVELNVPTHDLTSEHLDVQRFAAVGCDAAFVWTRDAETLELEIAADSPETIAGRGRYRRDDCSTAITITGDYTTW